MSEQDKKEFELAELTHKEAKRIISEDNNNDLDNFFLVLAVIFNDLKGIITFEKVIENSYRKAPIEEYTPHAGEYAGIFVLTNKILIANVQEFFRFLNEKKNILTTTEFKDLLCKTNKITQSMWDDIVNVAFNKSQKSSEFINYLIKIRNNVSFHYYQSDIVLRNAFCNFFNKKEKINRNRLAYYSIGESMEKTRFFYADASVGEYLASATNDVSEGFNPKYQKEMYKVIYDMNFAISRLLKVYLKNRPK